MRKFFLIVCVCSFLISCKNSNDNNSVSNVSNEVIKTSHQVDYETTRDDNGFFNLIAVVNDKNDTIYSSENNLCIYIDTILDFNTDGYDDVLLELSDCGNCCGSSFEVVSYDGKNYYKSNDQGWDYDGIEINKVNSDYQFTIDMEEDFVETFVLEQFKFKSINKIKDPRVSIIETLIDTLNKKYIPILFMTDDDILNYSYDEIELYKNMYSRLINDMRILDPNLKSKLIEKVNTVDFSGEIADYRILLDPLFKSNSLTNTITIDNIDFINHEEYSVLVKLSYNNEEWSCCETELLIIDKDNKLTITDNVVSDSRPDYVPVSTFINNGYLGKYRYNNYEYELYQLDNEVFIKRCHYGTSNCEELGKVGRVEQLFEGYNFWIEGLEGDSSPLFSFGEGEFSVYMSR